MMNGREGALSQIRDGCDGGQASSPSDASARGVKEAGVGQEPLSEPSAAEQRAWIDRYMKAFEHADVEELKRLLTEDVLMEMPPMLNWFAGRSNYGLFMEWVFGECGTDSRPRRWRIRAAHTPDLHRHRRGHQPEFGVPGLRVFAAFGLAAAFR
jgi:hypothetical protein